MPKCVCTACVAWSFAITDKLNVTSFIISKNASLSCADTVKIKIVFDCDLVIDDFEEGTGKNAGRLGAIVVRSVDNRLRVGVGIGFSDKQRTEIWAARDQYQNKVVTVKANDILSKGEVSSLFLPRFVEIRDDKQTGDTFDRVIEQRNSVFDIISRMKTI